jgi:Bacterial Ig-like domain (group 3)
VPPFSDGTVVFQIATLSKGKHNLTAGYSGDGNFVDSTSATFTLTIN